eukprot:CFRG0210T1
MATSNPGEIVRMSGRRNPYPKRLGMVRPDAYADLLLINGNPIENMKTVINNVDMILKDGKIYKGKAEAKARCYHR